MKTPKLYIGTAGWSYEDWVGKFYPASQSQEMSWLKFYSRYFNTVEVNSSYYTYLAPHIVENWLRQTEKTEDFLFTVKLHMDFTHRKQYGTEQIEKVKRNLDILKKAERLGGVLMQFPYSFDFNEANLDYLVNLVNVFEEYDKFIEVRHKSWQNKRAKTVTFCTIDQPQIGEAIGFNPKVGNQMIYARLHGRNAEAWRKSLNNFGKKQTYEERSARYEYLYSPGELIEISEKLKEFFDEVKKVFVIMNNHPNANAVANAFELMHYLKDRAKIKMPPTIIKSHPALERLPVTN